MHRTTVQRVSDPLSGIEVIDAHHHLVFPQHVAYPDLAEHMPAIHRRVEPGELEPLLADARVDGTICVQATNDERETTLLLDVAREHDWLRAVVGWIPLHDPDAAGDALDRVASPVLVGVRHLIHREPDPAWLAAEPVLASLRLLAERSMVYELVALAKGHLDNALPIVEHVPELTLVIDHLGGPYVRGDRWEPWASLMGATAQHPRCAVKLSGLDPIDGSVEPYRRYVEHVVEVFGAERVMWASNWPATRLGAGYRAMLDDALDLLPELTPDERAAVFGANARRVYGLPAVGEG